MKLQTYTVYDPLSNFPFKIESPFPLKNKSYALHPAHLESFSDIYKYTKKILLVHESLYNIQSKRLALSILLVKLTETNILEFKQFSSLELSYSFFSNKDLLAKFFFIVPKLMFATPRERKRLPRFRITANQIGSIGEWIDLCIQAFAKIDQFRQHTSYDEAFTKANNIYQKWKLYTTSPHKFPPKLIHYVFSCTAVPPAKQEAWRIFFTESAGTLYLKHRIRSIEAVDLFWELLESIDHLECSDYQNFLIKAAVRFLKVKMSEWVDWHPQFLELALDYKISTPKRKAIEGLHSFWVTHEKEQEVEREERKALAKTVAARIAERKAMHKDKPVNQFDIIPSPNRGEQS